jgi:tetratricopeptide (TPR) repeat protein
MVYRPVAVFLVAGLGSVVAFAQTGSALVDPTRTSTPTPIQAPAAAAHETEKPPLTPEMRGDIFLARRMYREAIDAFREGSLKDPVLRNKTGIAFHQLLQLDPARKEYETAVKLKPDYVEAINNIGAIYYAKKSYRRAQTYFERALKIAPEELKSASIYVNLGSAEFSRKRYAPATEAFQTAMRIDPQVFERHSNFGVLMEERTVEDRAKFHLALAKLNAKMGRTELALQYLRKAFEEGIRDHTKVAEASEFLPMKDLPEFKDLLKLEPRVL